MRLNLDNNLFGNKEINMKKEVDFLESKTIGNLARSFASECMEGAKYQFMAKKCETKNLEFLKTTLKSLAKHEMSHAKLFWDLLVNNANGILENVDICMGYPFETGTLVQDFMFSSANENELYEHIYPTFAKIAKDEGFDEISHAFKLVATVENCHSMLLKDLGTKLKSNSLYKMPEPTKWKCSKCGFEHTAKTAFKTCPLCSLPQGYVEVPVDTGK